MMDDWDLQPARDLSLTPTQRYRSLAREGGLVESVARAVWWTAVRCSLALCHRIEYQGRAHLPAKPPFILVANHASHLDALVLGSALPLRMRDQLFPLAAGDVFFEVPAMAAFSALALNALPVWRNNCGRHALDDLRSKLLAEDCVYILFPEGTRSRTGEMAAFRAGLGMLVAGTAVPVVPCYLRGTFHAFPPDCRLPRFKKLGLSIGPPLSFESSSNDRNGWDAIAQSTEAAVRQLAR